MNVLYIAYSCLPDKGSEEKIGWNISVESAKTNRVFVVTKKEHKNTIDNYLANNPIENITFYYVDIPEIYKKLFKGVAYSLRLNIWLKAANPVVEEICHKEKIDIVHQITPIEFRSIGNYFNIPDVKIVCGPLGGGEVIPSGLKDYAVGNKFVEYVRLLLNKWYKAMYRQNKKLEKSSYILFTNKDTEMFLSDVTVDTPKALFSDTGISSNDFIKKDYSDVQSKEKLVFLVAGRLVYRKGHKLLLDALKKIPNDIDYECRFVGEGPETAKLKQISKDYGLEDKVFFTGRIPFTDMVEEYKNADVFIMPSIRETSGAVLLEAMSKGLPVISLNQFGSSVLLDDDSAWFFTGNTKEEYIKNLSDIIIQCCTCRNEIERKGINAYRNAEKHIWQMKIDYYNSIYSELLS